MLVPALSHSAEALGELVWDFWFDSHHTSIGLCWLDFISPCRAGRGRRSWSLPALHSHGVSHGMVAPWGWRPLGEDGHCMPCAGYEVTDYLELEGTHEDHRIQLLGH